MITVTPGNIYTATLARVTLVAGGTSAVPLQPKRTLTAQDIASLLKAERKRERRRDRNLAGAKA